VGPFFIPTIALAVVGFLSLLAWAAHRGRPRIDPHTGALLFRHSIVLRGFAFFSAFVIPLGITVLVFFKPPKDEGDVWAILGLYGLFGVLSAPLLWEATRFSLVVSPDGLDCRSPWRPRRFVPWDEVVGLSYSQINSWFVLRTADGWKFRVLGLVPGLSQFLEQVERHLPAWALREARAGYARLGRPFPEPPRERSPGRSDGDGR
jgi:hypothetical protein